MQPRLTSSHKWTPVPPEFLEKVVQVFADHFPDEADGGEFLADGRIYPEEILLRVGYLESGRLRQMNVEASMAFAPEKTNALERMYLGLDCVASLMDEYLEVTRDGVDEDTVNALDLPEEWRPYEIEGETVYLQTSTVNTRLEQEADRLLGIADESLVQEESATEDALARAVIDSDLAFEVQKQIRKGPSIN